MALNPVLVALAERHGLPAQPYAALLEACGVSDPDAWVSEGQRRLALVADLPGDPSLRWGLWLPLFSRVQQLLDRGERLVLGVNGPIGAGKSTLMGALLQLTAEGRDRLAVASIDDAYLPWPRRQAVLAGNPFGVWRGPPGSHDAELLLERLAQWQAGAELVLPRFDKRLREGQGDRCGEWRGRPQLLVLEGWLLGCQPLVQAPLDQPEQVASLAPGLSELERAWLPLWNQHLGAYQPLWQQLEGIWVLRPSRWQWPRRWRFQAEARQRRSSPNARDQALTPVDLERLVRACGRSLPPNLYQDPLVVGTKAEAVVVLDGRRRCRWSGPGSWFVLPAGGESGLEG